MTEHAEQEQRSRAFLTHLEPEYDDVLLHLLECPECQGFARGLLKPGGVAAERPREARASRPRPGEGDEETSRRLERLLAATPAVRSELLRSEELRDLSLAGALLARAEAAQPGNPGRSEELARLAFAVAEPMVQDRWVGRANDVKARACVLVGNVRRMKRDREGADEMFSKAVFHLTGPPTCRERSFYCRNLALLRADQGQVDEAVGLLWRAALIDRENGELRDEGYGLAQLGFLFLEEEQVERAVPPLTRACQALPMPDDAVLYVRCALALSYCHASLGESERSRRYLAAARGLYPLLPAGEPKAQAAWLEGKVMALTGAPEDAAVLLDDARRDFIAAGKIHVAARVSMDLVRALAGLGREDRFESILQELDGALPVSLEQIGLYFALAAFVEAARRKEDLREVLAVSISRLRCCRRDPILVLGYWPPEMNGTATLDGDTFDPSLKAPEPTLDSLLKTLLLDSPFFDRSSGTLMVPDVSKGDARWK